jgi:hypothetical protein
MAWLHDLFLLLPASRAFPVARLVCSWQRSFPRQPGHFPDGIVLLLARNRQVLEVAFPQSLSFRFFKRRRWRSARQFRGGFALPSPTVQVIGDQKWLFTGAFVLRLSN